MSKEIRSIDEFYGENPELADKLLWDREADPITRRGFLKKSSLMAMAAVVGSNIPFASSMPSGLIPVALADSSVAIDMHGKHAEVVLLEERPFTVEVPAHLLDDEVTPYDRLFARNNGQLPQASDLDPNSWTLTIDGEAMSAPKTYTLNDLKTKFKHHTFALWIECGGNGRSYFSPSVKGNQWTTGAIGCPEWTGVKLKDVLKDAGYDAKKAKYVAYYGKDIHLSGDPQKVVISRGCPIAKALEEETILAFAMNGADIPLIHGHPLRLLVPGYPASASGKWLTKLSIRDKEHDGPGMNSYRMPCTPVEAGSKDKVDMCVMEGMPVKSLITYPKTGATASVGKAFRVRGKAWEGFYGSVKEMHVSIDFGQTWQKASLKKGKNKFAWQVWEADVKFPTTGYYEVWARATDPKGVMQPMITPGWNAKGYSNNMCHRIAVRVS